MSYARDVADFYDQNREREWNRLTRSPYHTLEFLVYMHYITAHLPPGALILDAGGGPGRYTIELARRGYHLVLLDISKGELALARAFVESEPPDVQSHIRDIIVGDISDLSTFADDTFDAVLCLDPLTYFPEPEKQARALAELIRIAKPQALVVLSVRGYLAVLRTILRIDSNSLVDGTLEQLTANGNAPVGGVLCHFYRARELKELAETQGLETILMAGAEGLSDGLPEATNLIFEHPEKWEKWIQLVIETATDPTVVDMSGHMLYLGRKSQLA